jgi:hypothetical protein
MTTWTSPADVEARLRKRWDSGALLQSAGLGEPWEPLSFTIRGPAPRDVAPDLARVRSWAKAWSRADGRHLRVEYRQVGGRLVGANQLPAKAWIDSRDDAWALLGLTDDAAAFRDLLQRTSVAAPGLTTWMTAHPLKVLELRPEWTSVLNTVLWIDQQATPEMYVRQIDVPGVDTKFIERHRPMLCDLLDLQLAPHRINASVARSNLAGRYGFREAPRYVRMRTLDPTQPLAGGFTEVFARTDELAATPPPGRRVFVMENATTYLAFPDAVGAVAILGSGYGTPLLNTLTWLDERDVVYWGDIDTHGYAILNRMRQRFPHVRSILMDRATLLAHESQWVTEPQPLVDRLPHLTSDEADLYRDLVEHSFGRNVRLEQERVSYAAIQNALAELKIMSE